MYANEEIMIDANGTRMRDGTEFGHIIYEKLQVNELVGAGASSMVFWATYDDGVGKKRDVAIKVTRNRGRWNVDSLV